MNQDTIKQVQQSFKALVPIADQVGDLFYARLFEIYPAVRPMFVQDIKPQAKKLSAWQRATPVPTLPAPWDVFLMASATFDRSPHPQTRLVFGLS